MKIIAYVWTAIWANLKMILLKMFWLSRLRFSYLNNINSRSSIRLHGRNAQIKFGRMVTVRPNVEIHANNGCITIGDKVFVNRNVIITAHQSITIGDGTTIGPNVCMYDHDHNFKELHGNGYVSSPIIIGKNVWIGAGSLILKGAKIGDGSIIAAGTIVTKDVASKMLVLDKREKIYKIIGDSSAL